MLRDISMDEIKIQVELYKEFSWRSRDHVGLKTENSSDTLLKNISWKQKWTCNFLNSLLGDIEATSVALHY